MPVSEPYKVYVITNSGDEEKKPTQTLFSLVKEHVRVASGPAIMCVLLRRQSILTLINEAVTVTEQEATSLWCIAVQSYQPSPCLHTIRVVFMTTKVILRPTRVLMVVLYLFDTVYYT